MSNTNRNPEIRVYPHARHQLKVMAAQRNMTMQDFVAWLVEQEQKRAEKRENNATQDV